MSKVTKAEPPKGFTGKAVSVECFDQHGYSNYKLITLILENGRVVSEERSDPFANFEAILKVEKIVRDLTLDLNSGWAHGRAWK